MEAKCYRAMRRAQGKMLREYFSGVSVESLSRRYGYSVIKIKTLASDYKQGKIDIFDDPQKRKIATSIMTHQEEVQLLRDKIRVCRPNDPNSLERPERPESGGGRAQSGSARPAGDYLRACRQIIIIGDMSAKRNSVFL